MDRPGPPICIATLAASLRRIATGALAWSPLPALFARFTRGMAPVFMLHRFADPHLGVPGHDPRALRRNLAWLRRRGYRVLSIVDLVRELGEDPGGVHRAVALTVDDGYDDFLRIGWPIFAELDCPVTVFLTTDFVDGKIWCWWDRVEFALAAAARPCVTLEIHGRTRTVSWTDAARRQVVVDDLVEQLKRVSEADRLAALAELARQAQVEIPTLPTPSYAPLRWDQVRRLEQRGVTFGPHSLTHPILSRTSAAQSEQEIRGSWDRLRSEISAAVPVFCYPNGGPHDYTIREMRLARSLGFTAALATHRDYARSTQLDAGDGLGRYALPRFPWPDDQAELMQIVSGVERAKSFLRGP
jgi:peptidoglycan/xylan/chitin deacetylase (PgdA/CDA1 family)